VEGCGQEAPSKESDAVSSASRDLGQESVSAELADEAADASTTATGLSGVGGWGGPELILEVTVAEAVDQVAAGEEGAEQVTVGVGDGVEAGKVLTELDARAAEGIELCDGSRGRFHHGQGIEIESVGGLADLYVTPEVVKAFVHAHPTPTTTSTTVILETEDPVVSRVVDHGLDPQHAPLVVELEPVLANAVLDTAPLGTSGMAGLELSGLGPALEARKRTTSSAEKARKA
jgi:hypothetical protein